MAVISWDSGHCLFFGDDACRGGLRLSSCASCLTSRVRSHFASCASDNQGDVARIACGRVFRKGTVPIHQHFHLVGSARHLACHGRTPLQSSVEDCWFAIFATIGRPHCHQSRGSPGQTQHRRSPEPECPAPRSNVERHHRSS